MSNDAYDPSDHIDWDLIDKDHTIEWLVHLCEVFNRPIPKPTFPLLNWKENPFDSIDEVPDQWITWPEDYLWSSNHTSIPEEHRQMWLKVIALICQSPGITVSGNDIFVPGRFGPETVLSNDISVTGRFGSEFKIKMMSDLSDWSEIEHTQGADCVPEELHHLLKEYGNYIPENVYLCWNSPIGTPSPVGLYSLLLAMLDETKVWEFLLDYIDTECRECHDGGFLHRADYLRQPGRAPGSLVGWNRFVPLYSSVKEDEDTKNYYLCYWCGPNAPDHH